MYSEIWLPDRLDSEKWLSSLLSIRLNWKKNVVVNWVFIFKCDSMVFMSLFLYSFESCVTLLTIQSTIIDQWFTISITAYYFNQKKNMTQFLKKTWSFRKFHQVWRKVNYSKNSTGGKKNFVLRAIYHFQMETQYLEKIWLMHNYYIRVRLRNLLSIFS